jgi:hypothetical protein
MKNIFCFLFYLSEVDFGKKNSDLSTYIYYFKLEGENYDADFGGGKSFFFNFFNDILKELYLN